MKYILRLLFFCFSYTIFGQAFISTWNTSNIGSSATNEITIPTNPNFTNYNYSVDWGDGTSDTNITGNITHTYATPNIYTVSITGTFPAIYFNNTGDRRKITSILDWGTIQWQSMENAFFGCENLNFDLINSPDLSQTTSLRNMFRRCTAFNGIVNNWNVSTITDISGLFYDAEIFNRPLNSWVTNSITDMSATFRGAELFNEPLDNWQTGAVLNMSEMFYDARAFNRNINGWIVNQVTNMSGMFFLVRNFNHPLDTWQVNNVTNMASMFSNTIFNQNISNWNVANVTNMQSMFSNSAFNQPLGNWNVGNVTNMANMFGSNTAFNQPINTWNVSAVTNMSRMFAGSSAFPTTFNQPLDQWVVSSVTNMSRMFSVSEFNQPINTWNVSSVTDMSEMFAGWSNNYSDFDQPLNTWITTSVQNMSGMFQSSNFNQDISMWDVSNVTNMSSMFQRAQRFNQALNGWNVGRVTNMSAMFSGNTVFTGPLNNWNTANVTNMNGMFNSASSFDHDLTSFTITNVTNMGNMLANSGLSQANYDATLIGWATQSVRDNVSLGALNLNYCDGRIARQQLIDSHNWNITGDIINCSFVLCTNLVSPLNGDTNVPANANLTWAPTPGATGYRVTVRILRNGVTTTPFSNIDAGNNTGLNLETPLGADLLEPGDQVFVTVVPYNTTDGPAVGCTEESFTVVPSWVNSPEAFKLTIDTRFATGANPQNQLSIRTNPGFTYNYSIDWGDDEFNNNVNATITHTYPTPGIYTISIIGTYPSHNLDNSRESRKVISIDQWGTQIWQSMNSAFHSCRNFIAYNATDIPNLSQVEDMTSLFESSNFNWNINNWDVSNVTNMNRAFIGMSVFNQPLDNWNVSNVTTMIDMFLSSPRFNQPIGNWNVSNVTNMSRMFDGFNLDMDFNQPLNSWNVSNVTNMTTMFRKNINFNQPLNTWNVSNVISTQGMFQEAHAFNQDISTWNVANVSTMSAMFREATVFNQPLNTWAVSSVTNMSAMFQDALAFNQPINTWNVSSVTNMGAMFQNATSYNRPLNPWNVTNVLTMERMFNNATAFNQPLNNWNVDSVVNMASMFQSASVFNQPLNTWNVSAVANMTSMFESAIAFNQALNNWDVSSVTLMRSMFEGATVFNQNLNTWDVGVVTTMEELFKNAVAFNEPLNNWDTREVLTMREMFSGSTVFNQAINSWNTSFVTTMEEMFKDALAYNQTMNAWNVASVTTMRGMFEGATAFNSGIDNWNVRRVGTMENMFLGATSFNQSLNNWRVTNVQNMNNMFNGASAYNQAMNQWSLGSPSMRNMFTNASAFNQNLGDWNISGISEMRNMLDNSGLHRENYDNTLIAWSEQTLTSGVQLGARGLPYCDALEERQSMIDNAGWAIIGDVLDCPIPECTQLISPLNAAINVPANTNLNWEPSLFARGYRLTVGTSAGGNDIVDNETINDTFYEFTNNFNSGETVFVNLIPFNDEGDAVGPCTEESFTISTDAATVPHCTNLLEPLPNSTAVVINSDLRWQPIANADGYRITVGTSLGGNEILNDEDVSNTTSYEFTTNLPENTDIFVTITPYNEIGVAVSCATESFRTELIPVAPNCTQLLNPLNNATNVAINTNLSWAPVDGATGYLVIVGTTSGGIEVVNNIEVENATNYTFSENLLPNRSYFVRIIPFNAIGDAMGCTEETFRTGDRPVTDPPSCTTLIASLHNAVDVAVDTDISWEAVSNVTGYNLTIGTSAGASDILTTTNVGNLTTYDLGANLPAGTTIFVSIVPVNSIGAALNCMEQSFTTAAALMVPDCTTLVNPLNGATNISVEATIRWNPSATAEGYFLSIGTIAGGTDILNNQDVGSETNFVPINDLPNSSEIFVTITPYNDTGNATGCSESSFTTESSLPPIPNCTSLDVAFLNALEVSVGTAISWDAVSNATNYRLTLGTFSGGGDILPATNIGNITTYDHTEDLPEATRIFVSIIPLNVAGQAVGCEEQSFVTETILVIPECTSLTSPLNEATDVPIDITLFWEEVSNADGYRLTMGTGPGASDILNNEDVGFLSSYTVTDNLPFNTTIYVSITPYNSEGNAMNCTEQFFTTVEEELIESEYGFSPNGDGINDFWEIKGIENSSQNMVTIYNRWGDVVFIVSNYDNQANVFRGEANQLTKLGASSLPSGTYFFDIQITGTHNLKKIRGFVVLKR